MLYEFLAENERELVERCCVKAGGRPLPPETRQAMLNGIPIFLRQLIKTLALEQGQEPLRSHAVSGPAGGGKLGLFEMGETAALHGRELLDHGFTVDQVVHAYGDACQAITDLAFERQVPFEIGEFRTLNRCLDNAIAEAVTEFSYQREVMIANQQSHKADERLGILAHELRNLINTATLTFAAIKDGDVGLEGATSGIMERTLLALGRLVGGALSEVRMHVETTPARQLFSLADFIVEIKISAMLEVQLRKCVFMVSAVNPDLAVVADRHLLSSAVENLLQNAFKFTRPATEVRLSAYASADRILIDVADQCGGLPWSEPEKLFMPFSQGGADKTGLGLGLTIVRRSVEANDGVVRVRNKPGEGCIFTIDLPRHSTRNGYAATLVQ